MHRKKVLLTLIASSLGFAANVYGFCPTSGTDLEARAGIAAREAGEFVEIGLYNGTKGIGQEVFRAVEDTVARVSVSNCTGVLLPGNRLLTAGHCFTSATQDVTGHRAIFNHELDENGNARATQAFPLTRILERNRGGFDYAIVGLANNPGRRFPVARLSNRIPFAGENLVGVNHSGGNVTKTVESGQFHQHTNNIWLETRNLITQGGASGGGIVDNAGFVVSQSTGTGCRDGVYYQGSPSIRRLTESVSPTNQEIVSPVIQGILAGYTRERTDGYINQLNASIEWANVGNFHWLLNSGTTPSASTGPSSGSYAYFPASQASRLGNTATLVSHPFIAKGKLLRFNYHMFGADIGQLAAEILVSGTWTRLWSLSGQQQTSSAAAWKSAAVKLDGFTTGPTRVRFVATAKGGSRGDIAIDGILIEDEFPVSGARVCLFNDPVVGTTPGCIESFMGTTNNTNGSSVASYAVKKNGTTLINITKTKDPLGRCFLNGSSSSYIASGTCSVYSVTKQ